jgi:hypothetical protein
MVGNDVPALLARQIRASPAKSRNRTGEPSSPGTVNAVRRFPVRSVLFRVPRWYSLPSSVAFRSIPWPPAPTGKASFAFHS